MPTSQEQLDSFHRFALDKLQNGRAEMSLLELVQLWRLENPTADERAEAIAAIKQGQADIEAGNYRPVEEFMDEMREKHGIPGDT